MKCLVCLKTESGIRYGCDDCVVGMLRQLREIEEYVEVITEHMEPTRGGTGRGSPGYRSSAPINLDKVVALDPRSLAGHVDQDGEPCTSRPDDTGSWTRSIIGGIAGINAWLREERGERPATGAPELDAEIIYLRGRLDWAATKQWVDELASDIRELHQQARALAGDRPPGPLGRCLTVTCAGTVFQVRLHGEQSREDAGRCDTCDRVYTGLDLVRLATAEEVAG